MKRAPTGALVSFRPYCIDLTNHIVKCFDECINLFCRGCISQGNAKRSQRIIATNANRLEDMRWVERMRRASRTARYAEPTPIKLQDKRLAFHAPNKHVYHMRGKRRSARFHRNSSLHLGIIEKTRIAFVTQGAQTLRIFVKIRKRGTHSSRESNGPHNILSAASAPRLLTTI